MASPLAGVDCSRNPDRVKRAAGNQEWKGNQEMASGAEGSRTLGLCSAIAALSQLSYRPKTFHCADECESGKRSSAAMQSPDLPYQLKNRRAIAPGGLGRRSFNYG